MMQQRGSYARIPSSCSNLATHITIDGLGFPIHLIFLPFALPSPHLPIITKALLQSTAKVRSDILWTDWMGTPPQASISL